MRSSHPRRRTPIQMQSATYAAVRSGSGVLLRITADTASSAVCGAPHTGQFERDLIRERTRAGLAAATARGRPGGRKRVITPEKLQRARAMVTKGLTVREAASRLKVGKTALYDALRDT
jgi:hypothetical protein